MASALWLKVSGKYSAAQLPNRSQPDFWPLMADKPVLSTVLVLAVIVTFFANLLVILTILLNRNLHNIHNFYFISSSACGLLLCVDFSLEVIQVVLDFNWPFNLGICVFWEIFDMSLCSVVLQTFTLISFNRYRAIKSPHEAWASRGVQRILIALIWVFPFAFWTLVNVTLMLASTPPDNDCFITYSRFLCYGLEFLTCFVPMCCGLVLNVLSIRQLRRARRSVIVIRLKKSSKFRLTKDQKAIAILLALELTTIICWMPYIVILPLPSGTPDPVTNAVFYFMAYLASFLNAVIILSTNQDYKYIFAKLNLLSCCWTTSHIESPNQA